MENKLKKSIFITGGAGLIGTALKKHIDLVNDNIEAYPHLFDFRYDYMDVDKSDRDYLRGGAFLQCDLMNLDLLTNSIALFEPDVIVHLAAYKDVSESVRIPEKYLVDNVEMTKNLLTAAKQSGRNPHIVFASSAAVYFMQNPYAESKLMCEKLIAQNYNNYTLLRFFNVLGYERDGKDFFNIVLNKLRNNEKITLYGNRSRDYVGVEDVCKAIMYCVNAGGTNDKHDVGLGTSVPNISILETLEELTGTEIAYEVDNSNREYDVQDSFASNNIIPIKYKSLRDNIRLAILRGSLDEK